MENDLSLSKFVRRQFPPHPPRRLKQRDGTERAEFSTSHSLPAAAAARGGSRGGPIGSGLAGGSPVALLALLAGAREFWIVNWTSREIIGIVERRHAECCFHSVEQG